MLKIEVENLLNASELRLTQLGKPNLYYMEHPNVPTVLRKQVLVLYWMETNNAIATTSRRTVPPQQQVKSLKECYVRCQIILVNTMHIT